MRQKIVTLFISAILFLSFSGNVFAEQVIVLPSAVRTATTSATVIRGSQYCGVHAHLEITAVPGGDTVKLGIYGVSPDGDEYLLLESATKATTGNIVLKVFPGATASANLIANDGIPDTWKMKITHSAGSNFTYLAEYNSIYCR